MIFKKFYFTLKVLFVLEIFAFLSCYFGHVGKGLGKKAIVNCKVLTSQTGQQTVTIYIARYRKKKDNETMKLSQLIEYYMRNIFL